MALSERLGVALLSSILLHALFLSWLAPPRPLAGEFASLTVVLTGLPGGTPESVGIPERPSPPVPDPAADKIEEIRPHVALPRPARVHDVDAPVRAAPERSAGPIPLEARPRPRNPYVTAQMTTVPPQALGPPEGYAPQEELERAPEPLEPITARYPGTALTAGRSGFVIAELLLSAEGTVVAVNPWQPEQAELVPPAVEALRNARFRPAERSGAAVPARVFYVVLFVLE
jgi:hypothetical protein